MKQIHHLITGGAGFIGAHLARRLVEMGDGVLVVDDLSRGRTEFFSDLVGLSTFDFQQADCCDAEALEAAVLARGRRIDEVWHLAANSDIPAGVADPEIDLKRTFLTTFGVLQVMRKLEIPTLHFASSSAIYGDHKDREVYEDIGPLEPISNYGAMKLASEAQIRAASEAFLPRVDILRFPNVIGAPATHGVILDLIRKLKVRSDVLEVLGNGKQQKAYLHVDDLISAMLHVRRLSGRWQVVNIGPEDDGVSVKYIAEAVRDRVAPSATIEFGRDNRGWVGDVPRFKYSTARLATSGWAPTLSSREAVLRAVDEIVRQELNE
ncbi:MAG: SDR family NAD(P)-dependent oxidoreductase [Proteobacteria bacterium]|nr:SDR family NAD(P)-dependent oxidoreductase [Pseudomonadota bacterium]